ncbi:hypothetical protein LIER_00211 [Lithospermum erythrorhizon]|uniref:Uncharacterized protein n=1 Tax=Lithospermum erythrorhizon TaxID=34254 RepID=A0AAV3NL26_LITER
MVSDKDLVMAMTVQPSPPPPRRIEPRNKLPLSCTFCHKTRHDISSCYAKNGYPEGWGDRGRGTAARGGRGGGAWPPWWHRTKLLTLLGNSESFSASRLSCKSPVKSCLIDTGASSHVTGDLTLLSHISGVSGHPICLPDGQLISAMKRGRDLTTRNLIGADERRDGLYHYRNIPGWQLFDLETKTYFVSRDVVFYESEFPYLASLDDSRGSRVPILPPSSVSECLDDEDEATPSVDGALSHNPSQVDTTTEPLFDSPSVVAVSAEASPEQEVSVPASVSSNGRIEVCEELGRGKRVKMPSVRLQDYVTNTVFHVSPSPASLAFPRKLGTPYFISHSVNCNHFSSGHRNFLAAITVGGEPKSYKETVVDQCNVKSVQDSIRYSMGL